MFLRPKIATEPKFRFFVAEFFNFYSITQIFFNNLGLRDTVDSATKT